MQRERYSHSLEPFCIQHNKEKVMSDAVVVRRHKEKPRGKGECGAVGAKRWVEIVGTIHSAWLYAIQASCASRRTRQKLAADTNMDRVETYFAEPELAQCTSRMRTARYARP